MTLISTAYAHGGEVHHTVSPSQNSLQPVASHVTSPFVLKWAWDPTLIFFALMALLYIRGLIAFKGRAPVAKWQRVLFFAGIAVVSLASLPPIDTVADQLFSAHMVQHLMITSIGVPLITFGAPFFIVIRGLPLGIRRRVVIPILHQRALRRGLRVLQHPVIAVALFEATFWFWHLPKFYNLALLNDAIHLVEHGCMALTALNVWRILIDPKPLHSRLKLPLRILVVGFMMMLDTGLSAALTYSRQVWYAYDLLPQPVWWTSDRLRDQQLGGLIMWVPGGVVWLATMIVLFSIWFLKEQSFDTIKKGSVAAAS